MLRGAGGENGEDAHARSHERFSRSILLMKVLGQDAYATSG